MLAAAHDRFGQRLLALDDVVDALFQRPCHDELVHLHVAPLADAERPVGRLVLHGRVPPAVKVEDVVGARQVEAGAACPQAEHKDRRAIVALEGLHHLVALRSRRAAVQEQHLGAQAVAQMTLQQRAHLHELREDQGMVAYRERLFQHFGQDASACRCGAAAAPAPSGSATGGCRSA